MNPFIGNLIQNRRLLLYVKPLTPFINYKGLYFSRTLRDLRTFCLNVLIMDLRKIRLIQILYEGLDYLTKTMVESLCNGAFTSKTANDAWIFFEGSREHVRMRTC